MVVVWDPAKARTNFAKHGVDFADAAVALEDENALTISDTAHRQYRFKTLAMSPDAKVLLIVHAEQDEETIRIISARRATRSEARAYFEGGLDG
jgi:uncharacterized DUF497 family protein